MQEYSPHNVTNTNWRFIISGGGGDIATAISHKSKPALVAIISDNAKNIIINPAIDIKTCFIFHAVENGKF